MSTMAPLTGIDLFKTLHAVAIAGWATIVTINNVRHSPRRRAPSAAR